MGGIIKAGTAATTQASGPIQFDDMGNSYLAKVRVEAEKIIAQARVDAEKIKAQALEDGKKNAQQAVQQAVQSTLQTKVEDQFKTLKPALDKLVQELTESRQAWRKHWEEHALAVSIAVAERLVRGELAKRPEVSLAWIREALELAAGSGRIVLRLNPADHQSLAARAQELLAQVGKVAKTELLADPTITAGGCIVETDFGVIDQQLESQLARLNEELQ